MIKKRILFFQHAAYYHVFARLTRKVESKDFTNAKSYVARDKVCRMLAAECYELAQHFAKENKQKLSLQYIKLAAKLLGLSLKPKKLSDIDEIKKAISGMKEKGTGPNLEKSSG